MTSLHDLQEIKAKAFDHLMTRMQGNHTFLYNVRKLPPMDWNISSSSVTLKIEDIPVYEWTIRMNGTHDLRQKLMDYAANELSKAQEPKAVEISQEYKLP